MRNIRVLIVDDSPTVCSVFRRGLSRAEGIEVIGVAPDPFVARDMIVKDPPDVVTLDIEMPRMDGLTFLRKLMKHFPLPVVVVSTLTQDGSAKAVEALASGAVEVVGKTMDDDKLEGLMLTLVQKVRAASQASVGARSFRATTRRPQIVADPLPNLGAPGRHIVACGSSTGGTEALAALMSRLPADTPGMVLVQHIPSGFTAQMAARLDGLSAMTVREARDGDVLAPGLALVSPGDVHMLVHRNGGGYRVELREGPRVGRHKPAVDVLFRSVARAAGADAVGALLTGMGKDGAAGMLEMHQAGAWTIAQDEQSSVVWGMPRAAFEMGAATEVVALDRIAERICHGLKAPVVV